QRAARGSTGARKSAQQLIENARLKFFAADVIKKKKWPRAEHGDVVYAVIHHVGGDRVVPVRRKRDFQFCADAIDAGDQHRLAHVAKLCAKQTAEAADFSEHFGAVCSPNELLNVALELVAKIDIDAGRCISLFLSAHRFHRTSWEITSRSLCRRNDEIRSRNDELISERDTVFLRTLSFQSFQIRKQRRVRFLIGERFRSLLALLHDEFVERGIDGQGIIAGETGKTKFVNRFSRGAHHAFNIEITET